MPVPQWLQNIINQVSQPTAGSNRPPQALGYGLVPNTNTNRANAAASARLSALARYYGGVSSRGTMANLRRYEQLMPQQTARDTLFQQRYGMTRQQALQRYSNRQRLDYEHALRGWRATAQRYSQMALNYPMQENRPPGGLYGGGGGGGGGFGGGPGNYNLPEWYLGIMTWRI